MPIAALFDGWMRGDPPLVHSLKSGPVLPIGAGRGRGRGATGQAVMPPSIDSDWPVMYVDLPVAT